MRIGTLLLVCSWAIQVRADEIPAAFHDRYQEQTFKFAEDDGPGFAKHRVDGYTKVIGWQLNDSWYLGRQKGPQSGLALLWQGEHNQFSLGTKGMRLTRRF